MIVEEVTQYSISAILVGALFFRHGSDSNKVVLEFDPTPSLDVESELGHLEVQQVGEGYEQAQDCEFCKYIAKKKVKYEEGILLTPDALLLYALNYYTVRKNRKVWGQKAAEEQIVAISSTIEELKDANLQFAKSIKKNM
eukprot:5288845-Ditylum_brightwellii.AAC.3